MKIRLVITLLPLICSAWPISAAATTLQITELQPYRAQYNVYWRGFKVGRANHELQKFSNHWRAEASVKPIYPWLPFEWAEISKFKIDTNIQPVAFQYFYHERKKKKQGSLKFDWKNFRVNETSKAIDYAIKPTTQDKLSHFFQLRHDLRQKKTTLKYPIAKTDELGFYDFKIEGRKQLKTSLGKIETLCLSYQPEPRKLVTLWLAPSLDNTLIQLVQRKNGKIRYKMTIDTLELPN